MKISKTKGSVIAALIALTFLSLNTTSSMGFSGDFSVQESKTETIDPNGDKETVLRKSYGFKLNKNSNSSVVLRKKTG
jgi:hypothetical protein